MLPRFLGGIKQEHECYVVMLRSTAECERSIRGNKKESVNDNIGKALIVGLPVEAEHYPSTTAVGKPVSVTRLLKGARGGTCKH